ncbi:MULTISPECIES: transketolase [unclassified Facklamia]|uniref:transketolase n=1 Tax=Aerococcaceae TaxID=186827 RepID=UPI0013BA697A|nr:MULTISPECIES: transketolase [unclassified Facklamia]NEW64035.1 transketolase [Facklamia sp. 252]NEW67492.1 transketolase [Facklamia sp. 253]QQD65746.1 transketolase [Aerococcaceae bacterium zg-252]
MTTQTLSVNTLRALSVDQIEAANSGHPGLPLGAAPMAYALWSEHLRVTPTESKWINRDRFILSAGHGSALLYSLLHVSGFDVSLEDLKQFRQFNSKTPGHPEVGHTDGVEATTGPLGQGVAQAVGMALAETHLAAEYNTEEHQVIDHYTYTLVGDGDLMEGVAYEALSFAGKQQLGKLVVLYDSNDISLDGDLNMAFNENIQQRFESQNWHYLRVEDGNDVAAISDAIAAAKAHTSQPTLIEIKTVIGYGSPKQGTSAVHGAPLGATDWETTKANYGWNHPAFTVPAEAQADFDEKVKERGLKAYEAWTALFADYQAKYPEKAAALLAAFADELPEAYEYALNYVSTDTKADASRNSSGRAIQALSEAVPFFWGGSADLSGSNKTMVSKETAFMPDNRSGRNIWFGVREFAMAAIMNGVQLHGGSRVYGGTFFVFTDYLKAAVRLAALSNIPVTYVMTHDSIAVGEDGPTHEPIEQLAAFRALPNLNVLRPADENETYAAWKVAIESTNRPTMLVLTRQNLPVLSVASDVLETGVRKGGYVISPAQAQEPAGILLASGSEVALAIEAQTVLREKGVDVSVVSMPAMNLFDEQDAAYKESVLPSAVRNRVSIEMGSTFGWGKYVGLDGVSVGIDRFGASGNGDTVVAEYGFTVENIVKTYLDAFAN